MVSPYHWMAAGAASIVIESWFNLLYNKLNSYRHLLYHIDNCCCWCSLVTISLDEQGTKEKNFLQTTRGGWWWTNRLFPIEDWLLFFLIEKEILNFLYRVWLEFNIFLVVVYPFVCCAVLCVWIDCPASGETLMHRLYMAEVRAISFKLWVWKNKQKWKRFQQQKKSKKKKPYPFLNNVVTRKRRKKRGRIKPFKC